MQTQLISILESGDFDQSIDTAVQMLREGKLVVMPTETVYGAAGLLRRPEAVARLRHLRSGANSGALTLHLASAAEAKRYLGPVGELGRRMMAKLWPGPVALIFDVAAARQQEVGKELGVDPAVIYDGSTITLRCPDHAAALAVLKGAGEPVVAVRAGIGSMELALRAEQVARDLDGKVDLILDGGPSRYSKPSTIIRVKQDAYEIVRSGVYDQRIIERLLRTTILFVCSGNTCRSPMAEAIARHLLSKKLNVGEADLEKKGITVVSAGTSAMGGLKATDLAAEAVRALGAELGRHRSRNLSIELIHQADVIFTMTRSHAETVKALAPSAAAKVRTLDAQRDIEDPIGGDGALYRELAGQIEKLIEKRLSERAWP